MKIEYPQSANYHTPNNFDAIKETCALEYAKKSVKNTFAAKMDDSVYDKNSTTVCKYLLYFLELFDGNVAVTEKTICSRDTSTNICFNKITTEHIIARSGVTGDPFTQNERDSLGNLTLLGDNKNNDLDDKPFKDKKDEYAKSMFSLTRQVSERAEWTRKEFDDWKQKLKDRAIQIFDCQ